jgi:hypothetical protein
MDRDGLCYCSNVCSGSYCRHDRGRDTDDGTSDVACCDWCSLTKNQGNVHEEVNQGNV